MGNPFITLGLSTRDDFHGAWFTIQSMMTHHPLVISRAEILVVDNSPKGSKHAIELEKTLKPYKDTVRYVRAHGPESSCVYKDIVMTRARGRYALCCDTHVLFEPNALNALVAYYEAHPDTGDLITGPCLAGFGRIQGTHQEHAWRGGACGTWAKNLDATEPFEAFQQGTGCFSCRTDAWPGFMRQMTGHGGNETYLMERFRERGDKVIILPQLRWIHRFGRPEGPPYKVDWKSRLRNYLIGFIDLDRPDLWDECVAHYKELERTRELIVDNKGITDRIAKLNPRPTGAFKAACEEWLAADNKIDGGCAPQSLLHHVRRYVKPGMRTLEFGSGLSTKIFDALECDHTAIEHNAQWVERVRASLKKNAKVIHAPIDEKTGWYDWMWTPEDKYDVVLIDGPPGSIGREGCHDVLGEVMNTGCMLLLDDTHRADEQRLAAMIATNYGLVPKRIHVGGRKWDMFGWPVEAVIDTQGGPGTKLKAMLDSIGIRPMAGCTCTSLMIQMNTLGADGCERDRDRLIKAIRKNYEKYGLATKITSAVGWAVGIDPAEFLFNFAVS